MGKRRVKITDTKQGAKLLLMEHESGEEYLRRIASFIRTHETNLSQGGPRRRRPQKSDPAPSSFINPLAWFGSGTNPRSLVFSLDTHHLFYILMRLEEIGINVGSLDTKADCPSRSLKFTSTLTDFGKGDDARSLFSLQSSSSVSVFSLGGGWWHNRDSLPNLNAELKYLYSSFTKLPALSISPPGKKLIKELASQPPNENAIPLFAFKNLQSLECSGIDPGMLLDWDRLAENLSSLTVKRSGVEDISDIFIRAVVNNQARREGRSTCDQRHISQGAAAQSISCQTCLLDPVPEDKLLEISKLSVTSPISAVDPPPIPTSPHLSPVKWAALRYLSLADNALTFLPATSLQYLTSLTHLDLSSNLFVSVPPGLSVLHNLVSLSLRNNIIDSVLGVSLHLGQILTLDISHNRLESICGLERLAALERVDLRSNRIEESAEVGRLAMLPNIAEVWVEGNPFVKSERSYRIACFGYFWNEGKKIALDGYAPGYYERRHLMAFPEQNSFGESTLTAYSPPVVAVSSPHSVPVALPRPSPPLEARPRRHSTLTLTSPLEGSPPLEGKAYRKKPKRVVALDGEHGDAVDLSKSPGDTPIVPPVNLPVTHELATPTETVVVLPTDLSPDPAATSERHVQLSGANAGHRRVQTEFAPYASSASPPSPSPIRSQPSVLSAGSPNFRPSPSLTTSFPHASKTFSSKSAARRARVSPSMYQAPTAESAGSNSDEYRRRIEALRSDMGDGWLKLFSQSQLSGEGSSDAG